MEAKIYTQTMLDSSTEDVSIPIPSPAPNVTKLLGMLVMRADHRYADNFLYLSTFAPLASVWLFALYPRQPYPD